jgi:hypothetical protein
MATGVTGITGTQGMQGLRGLRGDPYGPTGPSFQTISNRLNIVTPSSSTIQLTLSNLGTFYNITSNATSNGFLTLIFPLCNATYPETNELFPTPEQAGSFWVIRNNYSAPLTIALSNGTVLNKNSLNLDELGVSYGQTLAITYNGSNAFVTM